ncbi:hypothetical protein AeMF1_001331 [Aphanomyces euteiches]|nr:hypothetical protein AeMF1_001331 [Aphanomyces euteiches]KAH9183723.1 hypothetical protein AeNC1_014301 [Aphanomyces euteiches]
MANDHDADVLDKKTKRRLYDRKKQKKKQAELKKLQSLVQNLMQRASQMQYFKQTMLPWKDIAITLGRETAESVDMNRMLRGELYQVESLAHALSRWVEKMTNNPVLHSPNDHPFTLQYTSLPETESVRRHGFDWITKHLFHNIDRAMRQVHFPSNLSEYLNIDAAFTPDTHVITTVNQRVEPVSLDVAAGCLKHQVFNYPGSVEVLDTLDEGMQYLRFKASAADHTFYENTLFREFRQRNRYVIIVHIISEDDKHPQQGARRNWTQWIVADVVDENHTLIRECLAWYGLRTPNKYLPVEESTSFGPKLISYPDEETKLSIYRRLLESVQYPSIREDWQQFRELAQRK